MHTKTPKGHLGASLFCLIHCYIYLLCQTLTCYHAYTLHCEPRPVSHAILAVGLNAELTGQGTNTHDLCVRSIVTRLVNYTLTQCILAHFFRKLHVVTFAFGARGANLHPSTTIQRLGILLLWGCDHKLTHNLYSPLAQNSGYNKMQSRTGHR